MFQSTAYLNDSVPFSTKHDKEWQKKVADFMESEGLRQMSANVKFVDRDRMFRGDVSFFELRKVIPQLQDVDSLLKKWEIPTFLKNYDHLGVIIRGLVGELDDHKDNYGITYYDELTSNEYTRELSSRMMDMFKQNIERELTIKLIKSGWDFKEEFSSEEEKQQYLQELQAERARLTPKHVQDSMNTDFKPTVVEWAEHTFEADKERYSLDEKDSESFERYLKKGRCFRHYYIRGDAYHIENWDENNVFFSREQGNKHIEKGEYVGRQLYLTPAQIEASLGYYLSKKEKDVLFKTYQQSEDTTRYPTAMVPHDGYFDHAFLYNIQELSGYPMDNKTVLDRNGDPITFDSFIEPRGVRHFDNHLHPEYDITNDGLGLRHDRFRVTEGYVRSFKKVGFLNFTTEDGQRISEIVTDELFKEFKEKYDIKNITTKSPYEIDTIGVDENTIVWDYASTVFYVLKISGAGIDNEIYKVFEMENQIRGNSVRYESLLPVVGLVDECLIDRLLPYQEVINIAGNQMYSLLEKELGVLFLMDGKFLASDREHGGDMEEFVSEIFDVAKDVGIMNVDVNQRNVREAAGSPTFQRVDLTRSQEIASRLQIFDAYVNKLYEQVGIVPPRLRQDSVKYGTAEGVKQSASTEHTQTLQYFNAFESFRKRCLDVHLNIAQYAQQNENDLAVNYTKSDLSKVYLKFAVPNLPLRVLGVLATSSSKRRKQLERFQQYIFNTNTIGLDEIALAEFFTSDTIQGTLDIAKKSFMRRQEEQQAASQQQQQMLQTQAQLEEQAKIKEWEREEYSKERDRENRLRVEQIEAMGRAADKQASPTDVKDIAKMSEMVIKQEKAQTDKESTDKKMELDREKFEYEKSNRDEAMRLEMEKLKTKLAEIKSKEKIALWNKN